MPNCDPGSLNNCLATANASYFHDVGILGLLNDLIFSDHLLLLSSLIISVQ